MKIAALSAAALAVLSAGAVATPSFAHDDDGYRSGYDDSCQSKQHDRGTTGAVLGGIAGALIGSNLASHHGGRAGGAALGAVAGAVIGNNIGRSTAKSSDVCEARDYGATYYRRSTPYSGGYQPYYGGEYQRSGYVRRDGYRAYRYEGYDPYGY